MKFLFRIIWILILLTSCNEVRIKVRNIPPNTPPGSRIYVMGNFNYWDPGDPSYQLKLAEDSSYYIDIPKGFGQLEFKISRGEWANVETDICGYHLQSRIVNDETDLIETKVLSWKDLEPINCGHITFKLKVPENTPEEDPLTLAGNFNLWNPDDSLSKFRKDTNTGEYILTIPKPSHAELLSVKVTRGDLEKAEADAYGNESPVRNIAYTAGDTIEIKVDSWEDLVKPEKNNVTIVLNSIPDNTPPAADIFISGDFNGWYPRDKNYAMKRYKGKYYISIPRSGDKTELKFTRGSWKTEEVDEKGKVVNNHEILFNEEDTVVFNIKGWKDLYNVRKAKYVTFEIVKLPGNTPPNDDIYITGNFNNWSTNEYQYKLKPMDNGNYAVSVPRVNRTIEYKFTRGSWNTEEVDIYGRKIKNRSFTFGEQSIVKVHIENWLDLYQKNYKSVKVIIDELPVNTPPGADIYFASDLNDWDPNAKRFRLKIDQEGKYYINLPVYRGIAYFKFTRGSWSSVETDEHGYDIDNRVLDFSRKSEQHFIVKSWHDRSPK